MLQVWNGKNFERTSLKSIGLRVQLGHLPGARCLNPQPVHGDFTVIHTNGMHSVAVDYCRCDLSFHEGYKQQQLLRGEWYPATHIDPQTAFTFRVLEHFHMQTLQGKVASYDYYTALEKLTNNTGIRPCKVGYAVVQKIPVC